MESIVDFKTATYTALIIQPPQEIWNSIQKIRQVHDKSFDRWMPHINLIFPFIEPTQFDDFINLVKEEINNFDQFEIQLNQFNCFEQGKNSTLFLQPDTKNQEINQLLEKILAKVPQLKNSKHSKFTPHLTVGQFPTTLIQQKVNQFSNNWKPLVFECKEIHLIHRNGTQSPFSILKSISLKQAQQQQE